MRARTAVLAIAATALIGASSASADYPYVSKRFTATTFFQANRPFDLPIDSIMIHDTEGTYPGTVDAFTNPKATAAVQYVVSGEDYSSDPAVTQFVADKDWTRSVNNWWFNETSIGVEHIGFAVAPAGYFTQRLYERSADLVGWVAWKYRIPLDRAHILGHDNIPNTEGVGGSTGGPYVQHWDPGPSWDWPYYMDLVRAAYERWSNNAPAPRAEIPARYTRLSRKIRMISVGDNVASARDWFLWTSGAQNAYTNVYADSGSRPALTTLVDGASDPSTYLPSTKIGDAPAFNKRDFSCDNFPWSIVPDTAFVISQVSASDLRAKAAWGEEFALLGRKRVDGVLYDKVDFSGTTGWVRDSDTTAGWGALVRFLGGSHPTTLFSGPEYPARYPPPTNPEIDTRICADTDNGFSRSGQTYVAQLRRRSQGKTWYQIDYNHRVAWVPADEVSVSAP
jgi:N-acetyl-anhydromuramyl-L-alanine amidase AmpD